MNGRFISYDSILTKINPYIMLTTANAWYKINFVYKIKKSNHFQTLFSTYILTDLDYIRMYLLVCIV